MCVKRRSGVFLQEFCVVITDILYLLTLSSRVNTEFKGNPFSGGLAVKVPVSTNSSAQVWL